MSAADVGSERGAAAVARLEHDDAGQFATAAGDEEEISSSSAIGGGERELEAGGILADVVGRDLEDHRAAGPFAVEFSGTDCRRSLLTLKRARRGQDQQE